MDLVTFVFVELLFAARIIFAMAIIAKPLEIDTSGTIPCDHVKNDSELRLVQWFKSKRIDVFVNGDPRLAQWRDGAIESQSNYHMENTTFSLVIEKATWEDEGLYKCSVERGDLFTESYFYRSFFTYALPRKDPEITLDTDLNRVHCTVEHVRPVIFPVFNFDCHASTETYAVLNEDGTYTTSVSCALPQTKSASRIDCSFSYLHYQGLGSLDLRNITTDFLTERTTNTVSPMGTSVTYAGDGCRTIDHTGIITSGIVIFLLLTVANFIMLIIRIKYPGKCHQGVQNFNKPKERQAMVA